MVACSVEGQVDHSWVGKVDCRVISEVLYLCEADGWRLQATRPAAFFLPLKTVAGAVQVERSCVSACVKLADAKWSAVAYGLWALGRRSPTFMVRALTQRGLECECGGERGRISLPFVCWPRGW